MIDFNDGFSPVIRVTEKHTDDTRDRMFSVFREMQLRGMNRVVSETFKKYSIEEPNSPYKGFPEADFVYDIVPVENELDYFKDRIEFMFDKCNIEPSDEFIELHKKYFNLLTDYMKVDINNLCISSVEKPLNNKFNN